MRHIFSILIISLLCCSTQVASAQKKIDDLVNSLENNKNVNTVYSEKRDPKTKKITRCSKVLTLPSGFKIEKAQKAFEAERKNAIEAVKREGGIYILRFQDDKSTRLYKLIPSQNNEKCIISIDIKAENNKDKKNKKGSKDNGSSNSWFFDFSDLDQIENGLDLGNLNNLDDMLRNLHDMDVEIHLNKDSLNKLKTDVMQSLSNIGNVVKSECQTFIRDNQVINIRVNDNGITTVTTKPLGNNNQGNNI